MKTRHKEWTGKALGAVVGFVLGIALFITLQMALNAGPNPIMFYVAGFAFGAAGSEVGSKAVLRVGKKLKITNGVFMGRDGWTSERHTGEGMTLSKDGGRLVIAFVEGKPGDTPATILERYAEKEGLTLGNDPSTVDLPSSVTGVQATERRSFTARDEGAARDGEVVAMVIAGSGLVFHGSAEAGGYAALREDVHRAITSLERE